MTDYSFKITECIQHNNNSKKHYSTDDSGLDVVKNIFHIVRYSLLKHIQKQSLANS